MYVVKLGIGGGVHVSPPGELFPVIPSQGLLLSCMSKRTTSRVKRQRIGPPAFGEASEADAPSAQNNIPTSSALCTRDLLPTSVPALTTLCGKTILCLIFRKQSIYAFHSPCVCNERYTVGQRFTNKGFHTSLA